MRVLVTGGTGFVGSHFVHSLLGAGHDPVLLVRNPAKAEAALGEHALPERAFHHGDVMHADTIKKAIAGCDAVVHCANVFSLAPADRRLMIDVNEGGTDQLIGIARDAGADPIVHVSSYVALLPADGPVGPDSPVGNPAPAYSHSKALAERVARRHQEEGAPVVTVYPGLVWGPEDPSLGESTTLVINAVNGKLRLLNDGTLPISDVRDVAAAMVAMLESGKGPRRYMVTGENRMLREVIADIGKAAGKNLWSIPVPNFMALAAGRMADAVRGRFGLDPALNFENPWLSANSRPADNSRTREELGIDFRALDDTIRDTVGWLQREGHI